MVLRWASFVSLLVALLVLPCAAAPVEDVQDEQATKTTVPVFIFDSEIRAAAPGIEKIITLTDQQKAKLQIIYDEVFASPTLQSAQKVLVEEKATPSQRQEATAVVQAARDWFRKRCNAEVLTPEQIELIRRVYLAYAEVQAEVRRQIAAMIVNSFAAKLDGIVTPEQKAAMEEAKAEMEAAVKAAAAESEQQPPVPEEDEKKEEG